jgi:nitroreductase
MNLKKSLKDLVIRIAATNRFFASLYYTLVSSNFSREHRAVLQGKLAYKQSLTNVGSSSPLLRRCTHRLEKGLIMQPRRDVFAEGFILETVAAYENAVRNGQISKAERKWSFDVLTQYFATVASTEVIDKAKDKFKSIELSVEPERELFIPYLYSQAAQHKVTYAELSNLFHKRRSIRWYQDRLVEDELIEKAVELASLAPSACNRQPYRFYVSKDAGSAQAIARCAGGTAGWVENIQCTIAVVGDLSAYPFERDRHLIYIDGALAAMQLMLAFETLGLATCPINWPDIESAELKLDRLLDLKPYERPVMLISVGYAREDGGIAFSQKKSPDMLIRKV